MNIGSNNLFLSRIELHMLHHFPPDDNGILESACVSTKTKSFLEKMLKVCRHIGLVCSEE